MPTPEIPADAHAAQGQRPLEPQLAQIAQIAPRPRPALPYTSRAMTSTDGLSTTVTATRLKLAAALD